MAAAQLWAAWFESQTYDEAFELAGGYSYWTTGDFRINTEQPPLQKYWSSLPLLFMNLKSPVGGKGWNDRDDVLFGREFLYKNTRSPDTILFTGRLMTIALSIALGVTLALWMRRKYGAKAALIALVFYAFEPTLIAHGHYTTADFGVVLLSFLTVICWNWYLETGSRGACALTGLLLGLSIGSKFSALFLLPVLIALLLLHGQRRRWLAIPAAGAIAFAVLVVLYAPEARTFLPVFNKAKWSSTTDKLRDIEDNKTAITKAMILAGTILPLPSNSMYKGLWLTANHQVVGHPAYLMGRESVMGWWYYFPVAFAVKTPAGTLLACVVALVIALRSRRLTIGPWLCMAVPFAVYWAFCLTSHVDIGVRHLLPIYPFLCALLGVGLYKANPQWLVCALLLLTAGETAARFPYYTAFFNFFVGGPEKGPNYLLDSNIDWGQDLKRLKQFIKDHDLPNINALYFGGAEPDDFNIWYLAIPLNDDLKGQAEVDNYVAISVTLLNGHYVNPQWYAWLRKLTPVERIGYSIYVFDLRKHH
jgi:Dolichyl-phosphate-mannose-protein mannosyltransferase